jgi:aspartate-semialdehyde dehydrogenase
MTIKRVGFVGWRGMVGSVLMNRMVEESDFSLIEEPVFFSTVAVRQSDQVQILEKVPISIARCISILKQLKINGCQYLTCQGSDYTKKIFKELKKQRMERLLDRCSIQSKNGGVDSTIVLRSH